jgi:hypothetical protein
MEITMSKKFSKVASNNTASEVSSEPTMAQLMAMIQKLQAEKAELTENVKSTVAKSQWVRKSFSAHSKVEYNIGINCGGVYNKTTYQIDFDSEANWNKFKQQITTNRNNSKILLKNSDLSAVKWLKKSEDGETFQVYAYFNSKEQYKSSPLVGLISNLFTFKVKPGMDSWHTLPASVFKEFWDGYSQIWSVITGDYNPQADKASKGGDDL